MGRSIPGSRRIPRSRRIASSFSRLLREVEFILVFAALKFFSRPIAALPSPILVSAVQHNLELMTHFDTTMTPEQQQFNAIRQEKGLRAALDWRDARFKGL